MADEGQTRLESWKEIGSYLQRDLRTARRWEKEEGLPVHRHTHKNRATVYAYKTEIDAWRAARKVMPEPAPPLPLWKSLLAPPRSLAFGVTMALCLVMVGNGLRPQTASAQTKQSRQIWLTSLDEDPSESVPSADGRYIGFTDWNTGELGIRDLTTGQSRRLTNTAGWVSSRDYAESSAISPDNRQIAYAWFATKELTYELRLMPVNGGSPRTVYRGEGKREYPKVSGWTPDSKQVLVVRTLTDRTSQLAFISALDGSVRVLKSFSWRSLNARLSPDGRFIAYDSPSDKTQAKDIFVIAADGSRETRVIHGPAADSLPQWSPDGSRILFMSDRTGSPSLWSIEMDNGQPKGEAVLVKAEIGIFPLGITRAGTLQYIAPGSSGSNIYSAELGPDLKAIKTSTLAVDRFLNSNGGPQISPDGEQLAYISSRTGGAVVVIRDLKTGEDRDIKTQFRLSTRYSYGPMWFPDGRSVLVASGERGGISFYRVEVSTGTAELVHHVLWSVGYQLSPDGKAMFYTEQPPDAGVTRLVRFDLESRRETELKKGERFIAVAVSPDSRQLAYSVDVDPGGGLGYLGVMPASGGESREVFRSSRWADETLYNTLAWTPDQKFLIFGQGDEAARSLSVLWKVPVTGGQPQQIGVSIPGRIKSPQIQPDGKRIFFSGMERSPDELWALENFLPIAGTRR